MLLNFTYLPFYFDIYYIFDVKLYAKKKIIPHVEIFSFSIDKVNVLVIDFKVRVGVIINIIS